MKMNTKVLITTLSLLIGGAVVLFFIFPSSQKTIDFGTRCTTSEQCEGWCMATDEDSIEGVCSEQRNLKRGCFDIVEWDRVGTICVD